MSRILFYLQYAARNLWRNRRWSTFAVFSVAAGVATVVALRSLGLAIGDALTSSVRSGNHGDITLSLGGDFGFFNFGSPEDQPSFDPSALQSIENWVKERGGTLAAYTTAGNIQLASTNYTTAGRPQFISTFFINPKTFPPTDDIRAVDPAGVPLRDLFQGGNEVVVSQNLASTQNIKVGDKVRVSGTEVDFVVRGIVPASVQGGLRDLFSAFFGFAYFDNSIQAKLPVPKEPNRISILLPDGTSTSAIEADVADLMNVSNRAGVYPRVTSVPQLLRENQQISDVIGSFIVVLGLGALLIGGVGIINTMLVMVRRRTEEIAALKTFGLKGRQVAALFMAEAFLLGLVGSLVGGVFGTVLSGLANAYGQTLIQQPLVWRIYPEAILFGLALGLVITVVFGVAPVLIAVKVRPATILRPNESQVPRMGCLQSLGMILLVVVVVGAIAGKILQPSFNVVPDRYAPNPLMVGIIGVAVTLLILGILIGLLWIVVWLIGKLPAFGSPELRLALRNLTTHRTRTATTLLALSAGMFALSSISYAGAGTRQIVQFSLSHMFGGNVLIFPVLPEVIAQPLIDSKLNSLEGLEYKTRISSFNGHIQAIDGVKSDMVQVNSPQTQQGEDSQQITTYFDNSVQIIVRDTTNPNPDQDTTLAAGRTLRPDDRGKDVAVVRLNPLLVALNTHVGSTLQVEIDGQVRGFEVVGLLPEMNQSGGFPLSAFAFGDMSVPPGVLSGSGNGFQVNVAQIKPEALNKALVDLSSMPLIYAFDVQFFDNILSRFIDQMSAIPILVGLLSLGAAAVIMANTVALATLERRRQIGILKAVGLKGRRVLGVMLLENTVVSLLGGLIGIGLSALGVVIVSRFSIDLTILIPADSSLVTIALVVAAVLIAWVATLLSARPVVAERVTNVLRYE
jgi:predicted lysophospholipase L1 biosynthesis ABC-type transport system permease subunit